MEYKYEEPLTKKFNEEYRAGRIPNLDLFNELKDVYAKAKAFDEIKQIIYYENLAWTDEGYYDGYQERIGKITEDVIDKYDNQMEDN